MKYLFLLVLLAAGTAQAAPSFDCGKARTKAERAICASAEASALDSAVAEAYRLAVSRLGDDAAAVARLKGDQKAFVTYRDKFIDNENLVLSDYLARRRDFLLSIDPTARSGVEGRWRSFWGETRIGASAKGGLDVSHWMGEPILQSWNCGDPQETGQGRIERGALVTGTKDDGLRFTRKGRLLMMAIISEPDVESGRSCGFIGKETDAMFPVMSAQPVVAEQRPQPPAGEKLLAQVLPLVPAEAFDHTSDGIAPDELKDLVAKGASANWTLKSVSPQKGVATARRPSAEVHLTRKTLDGIDLVEALSFNEKAVNYSYWAVGPAGKMLTAHTPVARVRLLNEPEDGRGPIPLADVPAPIRRYIDRMEQCQHWQGEAGDDLPPARRREIAGKVKALGCDASRQDENALKAEFRAQPRWLGLIARATRFFSE